MPQLAVHNECTGCAACVNICRRDAIVMRRDDEGFAYPAVDASKCVNCGMCTKVCPALQLGQERRPSAVYAAKAKSDNVRLESSSGGVFTLLARQVINQGGVVYGAAFDGKWKLVHQAAENEAELAALRGSKYLQSEIGDCYRQVGKALTEGRAVLFTGTPCQVAGLDRYLQQARVAQERLLKVEVVCHAAPSPLVWEKYIAARKDALAKGGDSPSIGGDELRRISFRRKNCGWKRYSLSLGFANDKEYLAIFNTDPFMRGFLAELYNRPSCHDCPCKNLKSGSDLTIGDYWGIETQYPEMDDDKGTSLVLVNTDKGKAVWEEITLEMDWCEATFEEACRANSALVKPTRPHAKRAKFFRRLGKENFDHLVNRLLRPSQITRMKSLVGRALRKLGLRK